MESPGLKFISIFNDVLGPVMRGQSSSHTAGSYYIGKLIRELLGGIPSEAVFTFAPDGSYARVFQAQGSDIAFAAGLMGWPITDERFQKALKIAEDQNLLLRFLVSPFPESDHPNSVKIALRSKEGKSLTAVAKSIGGGAVRIIRLNDWDVDLNGKNHAILVPCTESNVPELRALLETYLLKIAIQKKDHLMLLSVALKSRLDPALRSKIESLSSTKEVWLSSPFVFPKNGEPIFSSAEEIRRIAREKDLSLSEIALRYEAALSLFAAGSVGLILAFRATFAAEIAGCQVEIGAAGAMGAAVVVDAVGGRADQALDAAAVSFQNTMGSVCDLVQGICEIPCHTRNAVAAASAFVCADLVLGGYKNPIPLDETVDAVFLSGKMLPVELRCTSLGGLAVVPSALHLKKRKV